ncbi:MAG: Type 1 glutamine amidotransferase-like domain-containing protein, partial [Candidatus Gallimonas sp.]
WKKTGLLSLVQEAYERGVILCGLSAGAICWFEEMYSDSVIEGEYAMFPALGWIKGKISPHYNERMLDFDEIVLYNRYRAWGLENGAALEFVDGQPVKTIGEGKVFVLDGTSGVLEKTEFTV